MNYKELFRTGFKNILKEYIESPNKSEFIEMAVILNKYDFITKIALFLRIEDINNGIFRNPIETMNQIHNRKNGKTLLMIAVENNCRRIVNFLMSGCDINERDEHGRTCIYYSKNNDMMRTLLRRGVSFEIKK